MMTVKPASTMRLRRPPRVPPTKRQPVSLSQRRISTPVVLLSEGSGGVSGAAFGSSQ
jgi:hypothetical protein